MIFEQLNDGACKTYLIASETTKQAVLVDPLLNDVEGYIHEIDRRGLELKYVMDTHVHADHISGCGVLQEKTGAEYVMHTASASVCAQRRVDEGDALVLGDDARIEFLYTPGHTQDSLTLLLGDRILTGDFLFIGEGGAGRTDLPGGNAAEHWEALQKLAGLPDDVKVYPAHDYHGREHSTLGEERRNNPRLKPRDEEEYVEWLGAQRLGPAEWMADVIHANNVCSMDPKAAHIPAEQPSCEVGGTIGNVHSEFVRLISPQAAASLLSEALFIDVREANEFNGPLGHIEGSRWIPLGSLPARFVELEAYRGRPIITVCRSGGRSEAACAVLIANGFKNVASLDGGMIRWNEMGYEAHQGVH